MPCRIVLLHTLRGDVMASRIASVLEKRMCRVRTRRYTEYLPLPSETLESDVEWASLFFSRISGVSTSLWILKTIEAFGGKLINTSDASEKMANRYLLSKTLSASGIESPKTVLIDKTFFTFSDAEYVFSKLGKPVVVKPVFAGRGDVVVADSPEKLAEIVHNFPYRTLIAQEYVEHVGIVRGYVIGGKHVGSVVSKQKLGWKFTVEGVFVTKYSGKKASETIEKASEAVGAEVAAFDMFLTPKNNLVVFDAHVSVDYVSASAALGRDLVALLASYLSSEARK